MHDELRKRRVECVHGEREVLRRCESHVDSGTAQRDGLGERLGRIDGGNRVRADALHELARQRTRPTADVDHVLTWLDAGKIGHLRRELT